MQPVYNPKTMRYDVPPAQPAVATVAEETVYLSFPKSLSDVLASYANEDGMDVTAETERGTATKTAKAVKMYVVQAVKNYIEARGEA